MRHSSAVRFLAAISALALAACSEPTAPSSVATQHNPPSRILESDPTTATNAWQHRVKIGQTLYTLDTRGATLTFGEGKLLHVKPTEVEAVLHALEQIEATDKFVAAIEADPGYIRCLKEARRQGINSGVHAKFRRDPYVRQSLTQSLAPSLAFASTPLAKHSSGRSPLAPDRKRRAASPSIRSTIYDNTEYTCLQLSLGLWDATARWHALQDEFDNLAEEAAAVGATIGAGWFEFNAEAAGLWYNLRGLGIESDLLEVMIELNIIALKMNQQNCIYADNGSGGGGGSGGGSNCHNEWGEVVLVWETGEELVVWAGWVSVCGDMT